MLLAVKEYVRSIIATTDLTPTLWTQLTAVRQRIRRGQVGSVPIAAIGKVRRREQRLANPRDSAGVNGGGKDAFYTIEIMVMATHQDHDKGGDNFDVLIEQICRAFRSAAGAGGSITDPFTNEVTQVMSVGEKIDVDVYDPQTTGEGPSVGRINFYAVITIHIEERIPAW